MGRAELPLHAPGTQVDRGYIGESVPRPNVQRLLQGRGAFIDDLRFPRLAHVAFFRSPYAHALIRKLDFKTALRAPGVITVLDGRAVAEYCTPWVAVLAHLKGMKSPPQYPIAIERACWQGEAVAAVVAESRSQAEDGVALIEAEWKELPVVVDMDEALAGKNVIHQEFDDNICFRREHDTGGVDEAFARAAVVVEETFHFGRHTGVCLEGRAILADYNAAEHSLTVYHATQAPHMMQDIFSRHLNIPEANVRVITKDVGGSFGIKVHVYPDEMATAAISVMLRRPVKFIADRLESFLSDIHAREHKAKVRLACTKDGEILAFDLDDVTAIGPYSVYPRTSGIEGNQVVNLTGGPYRHQKYRAKMHVVFTNKNVTCQYRAVGHPIAVALTEGIVDLAAQKLGMDAAEFRRKNLIPDDAYPYTFPSGIKFEKLSHHKSLDTLLKLMNYSKLREEQRQLRSKSIYRGIGLAAMIEVTNPSPAFYGVGVGGEAVLLAGRALRSNVLDVAAAILKTEKQKLDVMNNEVIDRLTLETKLPLAELGRVAYFRPDTLPLDFQSELTVTRHYTPREYAFTFTNGIQASWLEVDPDTGFVKLLKHWCVEDAGTLINPMLVDEQIRGGVVQGIGAALYEECLYGPDGQLLNGNLADYLVPMSGEMCDIVCAHLETPTRQSQLGAKGVGEAGTAGAPAAIMNAINDALAPLGVRVTRMPFTPERVLQALRKV